MQYNATNWARRALYAELVKLDPPVEPEKPADLLAAVRAIKAECDSNDCCAECAVHRWCNYHAPDRWEAPEEVQDDGE